MSLPQILANKVAEWRDKGYVCADFPLIGDILRFQQDGELGGNLRFLRAAQFEALETYWYLRLVCKTPSIMDVYKDFYPKMPAFVDALGVRLCEDEKYEVGQNLGKVIAKIKDPKWASEKGLDAVHEAATLEYPGYIFALAMGAGKTVLIGAIIATEFAMAMHYDGGSNDIRFMQNALVFAPGKTIIESLREIAEMPMEKILPAQSLRNYQTSVTIVFPRDGQKEINVISGGFYNIIVSNTEKISLRADSGRKNQTRFQFNKKRIVANARLQKIISLPNLGVFSDEAHHTYGNKANDDLKRVRETVNYIHEKTPLVTVVNTTGTPYYNRVMLADVVFWYGLREGIRDNVLKSLKDGIIAYRMGDKEEGEVLGEVICSFFKKYGDVRLLNGAPAKIAFYFKQQEHLDESRPHIEKALASIKKSSTLILVNTQNSSKEEKDDFNRLNDPTNQKRVILLIQKGTEGWNCPSLFACAIIKKQTNPVFVLQAATRCLRQPLGNNVNATVYLSEANARVLDKGLKDNFGHDAEIMNSIKPMQEIIIERRESFPLPRLEIVRNVSYFVPKHTRNIKIELTKPIVQRNRRLTVEIGSPDFESYAILRSPKTETINLHEAKTDCYAAAARIAANYHLNALPLLQQLKSLYPDGLIPGEDITDLLQQVQNQTTDYEVKTEKVREVLALIREVDDQGKQVFPEDDEGRRVHVLRFSDNVLSDMRKRGLFVANERKEIAKERLTGVNMPIFAEQVNDENGLSYHYSPYCFDSSPEHDFFAKILAALGEKPQDICAFMFTGLANSRLTDFWFYYKDEDGAYRRYFPDFLLFKNSGEFYVVEIKSEHERGNPIVEAKAKAVEILTAMPENHFRYVVIYVNSKDMETEPGMVDVRKWIETNDKKEKTREQKEI